MTRNEQADPITTLVERFPRLFRGKHPRTMSDLPPGWTDLVTRLFSDIDAMLDDGQAAKFNVLQFKEKFAGLRVYWSLGKEKTAVLDIIGPDGAQRLNVGPKQPTSAFELISARVDEAEAEAAGTCQRCGNGGARRVQTRGWLVTLCQVCAAPRKPRKEGSP